MANQQKALEHIWNYFALHANQRINVFNFFVVFAGLLTSGMLASLQASDKLSLVGMVLGLFLVILSYVFWKVDQRTTFLIKLAEEHIIPLEPAGGDVIAEEGRRTPIAKSDEGIWSYSKAFRSIFVFVGLIGLGGAILSGKALLEHSLNPLAGAGAKLAQSTAPCPAPPVGRNALDPNVPPGDKMRPSR